MSAPGLERCRSFQVDKWRDSQGFEPLRCNKTLGHKGDRHSTWLSLENFKGVIVWRDSSQPKKGDYETYTHFQAHNLVVRWDN